MKISVPGVGQYLLLSDWIVNLDLHNHWKGTVPSNWKWRYDKFAKVLRQISLSEFVMAKHSVVTLRSVDLSIHRDNVSFAFYKKYNKDNEIHQLSHIDFRCNEVPPMDALFLDKDTANRLAANKKEWLIEKGLT